MNQQLFSLTSIPKELMLRTTSADIVVGIILFVGFVAVAIANFSRPNVYGVVLRANIKTSAVGTYLRQAMPIDKLGSILLLFNYFLTGAAITYLSLRIVPIPNVYEVAIAALLPITLLFWNMGSLIVTGWVTGEKYLMRELIIMKLVGAQLSGLVYFLCALIWTLNVQYSNIVFPIVIIFFIAESVIRWGKGILSLLMRGVAWYYIILYFCTLEILPFYVAYVFLEKNFETVLN